ncbi:unnamed protein product [Somion occarium]|uniref:NAD(P)-binding domain-containing protein n=1 Tax=Somion occarium TaxID=3059160 RepID=A0ABP1DFT4_9APHY
MSTVKNVYALGASRNIGYLASLRLLAKGAHITFLLRNPTAFESDPAIQPYLSSSSHGQAHIVKGDALNINDVKRGWEVAGENGDVDLILFTVGGTPRLTLAHGFVLDPPNLCTQAIINVLTTLPSPSAPPKIIAITSIGTTSSSHASVPFLLKPIHNTALVAAHRDKIGLEKVLGHVCGKTAQWGYLPDKDAAGDELDGGVLGKGWKKTEGFPKEEDVATIVVVRPAMLVDGECRADEVDTSGKGRGKGKGKEAYRVQEGDLKNPYTVSRKDVAHYIVEGLLEDWQKWEGKCVSIAY